MKELLKIKDLTVHFYTFEGVVQALQNLSLDIKQEETLGLVGETGCGKTMTALSILRLIPAPGKIENGSIYFDSDEEDTPVDLLMVSEDYMRQLRGSRISMVFQEPSAALNPVFTIGDQITEVILLHRQNELAQQALNTLNLLIDKTDGYLGALLRPVRILEKSLLLKKIKIPNSILLKIISNVPILRRLLWRLKDEARKVAVSTLKEVEIPDPERIIKQYPHQLSGGMKQRAVIAMALACSPKFLIADEPTTALDVTVQAQILELLRKLKDVRKSSVLYITHDLSVAAELCDRIGVMYAGSLCELAKAEDLYANPLHPYTKALLAAVPKPGEPLNTIGGFVPDPLDMPTGCRFHPRCDCCDDKCQGSCPSMVEIEPDHFVACYDCQVTE